MLLFIIRGIAGTPVGIAIIPGLMLVLLVLLKLSFRGLTVKTAGALRPEPAASAPATKSKQKIRKGPAMISDAAIHVFKSASIQPRFLTLTHDDVIRLESLASQVKEILDRGAARDDTPEWLKPPVNGNGVAK
ncbi:MAG TPA: hypothetical protein VN682_17830 [Terriglobales bacterium]|nr:hypothetical protein [Terriglobales bacterium]HXF14786.1 hypothetical protein [Terriglobales bacterium]